MRTKFARSKAAIAAALALGLGFVATPAFAADDAPVLTVENTTFAAGNWGDGIDYTVTGIPEGIDEVSISLLSFGNNGGGIMDETTATRDSGFSGNMYPSGSTQMPDAEGYPKYSLQASYTVPGADGTDEYFISNQVALTITEGIAVTGAHEATPAQLAAGVPLELSGYAANEPGEFDIYRVVYGGPTVEYEYISTTEFVTQADGTATISAVVPGAAIDDLFVVDIYSETGYLEHYLRVVDQVTVPPTDPTEPTDPAAPAAPTAPKRIETAA